MAPANVLAETYFYPRPPRGGRLAMVKNHHSRNHHFYPRPPRGGRPQIARLRSSGSLFLSTPSARRATTGKNHRHRQEQISIHALREEGDAVRQCSRVSLRIFLSTPSARRATGADVDKGKGLHISIHALREEGDRLSGVPLRTLEISIHALREEGDMFPFPFPASRRNFYPRPPRGGRRRHHGARPKAHDFYPRPPRGGRRAYAEVIRDMDGFLSTPSARRAT